MFLPKSNKKLTLDSKYTPTLSFLSPASKYNQRSFSTSSLAHNYASLNPINNSLKDQIRLQSFKRNVLTHSMSKLNKSAIHRANLKVQSIEYCRQQDMKKEVYQLQRQVKILQQQNKLLIQQRNQDLLLVSRQNQIIVRMEQQLKQPIYIEPKRQSACRCHLTDQCLDKIQFLQDQIRHLQQQKKEFKQQIHDLIVKQEHLKAMSYNNSKLFKQDRKQLNRGQQIAPKAQKEKKKKKQQTDKDKLQQKEKDSGVQRYLQYLKNVRNREIDHIQSILNND